VPQKQRQHIESPRKNAFGRDDRIRRRFEYLRVQQNNQKVHTEHFILLVRANQERRRLGITVTKQVSNAVGRNRIKRLVREVFRTNQHLFPEMSDVVVIARSGADKLNYAIARREIEEASAVLKRAARTSGVRLAADAKLETPDR
jgi:ribonuclease P protein component